MSQQAGDKGAGCHSVWMYGALFSQVYYAQGISSKRTKSSWGLDKWMSLLCVFLLTVYSEGQLLLHSIQGSLLTHFVKESSTAATFHLRLQT